MIIDTEKRLVTVVDEPIFLSQLFNALFEIDPDHTDIWQIVGQSNPTVFQICICPNSENNENSCDPTRCTPKGVSISGGNPFSWSK